MYWLHCQGRLTLRTPGTYLPLVCAFGSWVRGADVVSLQDRTVVLQHSELYYSIFITTYISGLKRFGVWYILSILFVWDLCINIELPLQMCFT